MTDSEARTARAFELTPLGDRAWLARFATDEEASAWAGAVRERAVPGVVEVVAAYQAVAVFADPAGVDPADLETVLRGIATPDASARPGRLFRVPVVYDGEDLAEVARGIGCPVEEVVARHAGVIYTVRAIGFLPGFPYLGELAGPLAGLPRRDTPRLRVPAGSVAIAGRQSCIYPQESPGGWHLLGRTPLVLADLERDFVALRAGDRIRFEPIEPGRFDELRGRWLDESWRADEVA